MAVSNGSPDGGKIEAIKNWLPRPIYRQKIIIMKNIKLKFDIGQTVWFATINARDKHISIKTKVTDISYRYSLKPQLTYKTNLDDESYLEEKLLFATEAECHKNIEEEHKRYLEKDIKDIKEKLTYYEEKLNKILNAEEPNKLSKK